MADPLVPDDEKLMQMRAAIAQALARQASTPVIGQMAAPMSGTPAPGRFATPSGPLQGLANVAQAWAQNHRGLDDYVKQFNARQRGAAGPDDLAV